MRDQQSDSSLVRILIASTASTVATFTLLAIAFELIAHHRQVAKHHGLWCILDLPHRSDRTFLYGEACLLAEGAIYPGQKQLTTRDRLHLLF